MESLHVCRDGGLEMIIAIDSTSRGPSLGGCRWRPYTDSLEARRDATRLARAMTFKTAMARLSLGGGKAVVVGDPRERTDNQLRAFGSFVDTLGGCYITGADMGTGKESMLVIRQETSWVTGLPERVGGAGDPAPFTALGILRALEPATARAGFSLRGARVAVQGVGNVGAELIQLLLAAGAEVFAADVSVEALSRLPTSVTRVAPDEVLEVECDIFAPCGPGNVIDLESAERIECRVVCGGANNPLVTPDVACKLAERGIIYVPDFVANAGGVIHLALSLEGGDADETRNYLNVIPENVEAVLAQAKARHTDTATAAIAIASYLAA